MGQTTIRSSLLDAKLNKSGKSPHGDGAIRNAKESLPIFFLIEQSRLDRLEELDQELKTNRKNIAKILELSTTRENNAIIKEMLMDHFNTYIRYLWLRLKGRFEDPFQGDEERREKSFKSYYETKRKQILLPSINDSKKDIAYTIEKDIPNYPEGNNSNDLVKKIEEWGKTAIILQQRLIQLHDTPNVTHRQLRHDKEQLQTQGLNHSSSLDVNNGYTTEDWILSSKTSPFAIETVNGKEEEPYKYLFAESKWTYFDSIILYRILAFASLCYTDENGLPIDLLAAKRAADKRRNQRGTTSYLSTENEDDNYDLKCLIILEHIAKNLEIRFEEPIDPTNPYDHPRVHLRIPQEGLEIKHKGVALRCERRKTENLKFTDVSAEEKDITSVIYFHDDEDAKHRKTNEEFLRVVYDASLLAEIHIVRNALIDKQHSLKAPGFGKDSFGNEYQNTPLSYVDYIKTRLKKYNASILDAHFNSKEYDIIQIPRIDNHSGLGNILNQLEKNLQEGENSLGFYDEKIDSSKIKYINVRREIIGILKELYLNQRRHSFHAEMSEQDKQKHLPTLVLDSVDSLPTYIDTKKAEIKEKREHYNKLLAQKKQAEQQQSKENPQQLNEGLEKTRKEIRETNDKLSLARAISSNSYSPIEESRNPKPAPLEALNIYLYKEASRRKVKRDSRFSKKSEIELVRLAFEYSETEKNYKKLIVEIDKDYEQKSDGKSKDKSLLDKFLEWWHSTYTKTRNAKLAEYKAGLDDIVKMQQALAEEMFVRLNKGLSTKQLTNEEIKLMKDYIKHKGEDDTQKLLEERTNSSDQLGQLLINATSNAHRVTLTKNVAEDLSLETINALNQVCTFATRWIDRLEIETDEDIDSDSQNATTPGEYLDLSVRIKKYLAKQLKKHIEQKAFVKKGNNQAAKARSLHFLSKLIQGDIDNTDITPFVKYHVEPTNDNDNWSPFIVDTDLLLTGIEQQPYENKNNPHNIVSVYLKNNEVVYEKRLKTIQTKEGNTLEISVYYSVKDKKEYIDNQVYITLEQQYGYKNKKYLKDFEQLEKDFIQLIPKDRRKELLNNNEEGFSHDTLLRKLIFTYLKYHLHQNFLNGNENNISDEKIQQLQNCFSLAKFVFQSSQQGTVEDYLETNYISIAKKKLRGLSFILPKPYENQHEKDKNLESYHHDYLRDKSFQDDLDSNSQPPDLDKVKSNYVSYFKWVKIFYPEGLHYLHQTIENYLDSPNYRQAQRQQKPEPYIGDFYKGKDLNYVIFLEIVATKQQLAKYLGIRCEYLMKEMAQSASVLNQHNNLLTSKDKYTGLTDKELLDKHIKDNQYLQDEIDELIKDRFSAEGYEWKQGFKWDPQFQKFVDEYASQEVKEKVRLIRIKELLTHEAKLAKQNIGMNHYLLFDGETYKYLEYLAKTLKLDQGSFLTNPTLVAEFKTLLSSCLEPNSKDTPWFRLLHEVIFNFAKPPQYTNEAFTDKVMLKGFQQVFSHAYEEYGYSQHARPFVEDVLLGKSVFLDRDHGQSKNYSVRDLGTSPLLESIAVPNAHHEGDAALENVGAKIFNPINHVTETFQGKLDTLFYLQGALVDWNSTVEFLANFATSNVIYQLRENGILFYLTIPDKDGNSPRIVMGSQSDDLRDIEKYKFGREYETQSNDDFLTAIAYKDESHTQPRFFNDKQLNEQYAQQLAEIYRLKRTQSWNGFLSKNKKYCEQIISALEDAKDEGLDSFRQYHNKDWFISFIDYCSVITDSEDRIKWMEAQFNTYDEDGKVTNDRIGPIVEFMTQLISDYKNNEDLAAFKIMVQKTLSQPRIDITTKLSGLQNLFKDLYDQWNVSSKTSTKSQNTQIKALFILEALVGFYENNIFNYDNINEDHNKVYANIINSSLWFWIKKILNNQDNQDNQDSLDCYNYYHYLNGTMGKYNQNTLRDIWLIMRIFNDAKEYQNRSHLQSTDSQIENLALFPVSLLTEYEETLDSLIERENFSNDVQLTTIENSYLFALKTYIINLRQQKNQQSQNDVGLHQDECKKTLTAYNHFINFVILPIRQSIGNGVTEVDQSIHVVLQLCLQHNPELIQYELMKVLMSCNNELYQVLKSLLNRLESNIQLDFFNFLRNQLYLCFNNYFDNIQAPATLMSNIEFLITTIKDFIEGNVEQNAQLEKLIEPQVDKAILFFEKSLTPEKLLADYNTADTHDALHVRLKQCNGFIKTYGSSVQKNRLRQIIEDLIRVFITDKNAERKLMYSLIEVFGEDYYTQIEMDVKSPLETTKPGALSESADELTQGLEDCDLEYTPSSDSSEYLARDNSSNDDISFSSDIDDKVIPSKDDLKTELNDDTNASSRHRREESSFSSTSQSPRFYEEAREHQRHPHKPQHSVSIASNAATFLASPFQRNKVSSESQVDLSTPINYQPQEDKKQKPKQEGNFLTKRLFGR